MDNTNEISTPIGIRAVLHTAGTVDTWQKNAPDWDVGAWMGTAGVRSRFYRKVVGLGACGTGWLPLLPSIADICACQTISQFGGVHDAHTVADADKFCLAIEKTEGKWYLSASGLMSHNSLVKMAEYLCDCIAFEGVYTGNGCLVADKEIYYVVDGDCSIYNTIANAENVWNAMGNPQGYIYATPHIGAALDHVDRDSRWIWMSPILEDIKLTLAGSQPLGMAAFSLPFATPSLILCDNESSRSNTRSNVKCEDCLENVKIQRHKHKVYADEDDLNDGSYSDNSAEGYVPPPTTNRRWQLGELVPAVLNLHVQLEIWKK
ncbi:hypothetical protein B0H14DRAFT_2632269 [Mycena olivaceomarginata]|nr:hypothetical protein B0H14DRAFT_2632269 [Mycena olivaceomarginata]